MKMPDLGRRAFCEAGGLALIAVALPVCGAPTDNGMCGTETVAAGLGSAVAVGTVKQIDRLGYDSLFLCRDAVGVYAMTAACTHNQCTLNFVSQAAGFACACHTATFDFNGEKPTAPAPAPLKHYALCSDGKGGLLIDVGKEVPATMRYKA